MRFRQQSLQDERRRKYRRVVYLVSIFSGLPSPVSANFQVAWTNDKLYSPFVFSNCVVHKTGLFGQRRNVPQQLLPPFVGRQSHSDRRLDTGVVEEITHTPFLDAP